MATISAAVKEIIEKRGLKEADIIGIIDGCGDDKIFNKEKGLYIAKKEIGDATVYAVFDEAGDVKSAYSHKMKILDIVLPGEEDSGWVYVKNGQPLKNDMSICDVGSPSHHRDMSRQSAFGLT